MAARDVTFAQRGRTSLQVEIANETGQVLTGRKIDPYAPKDQRWILAQLPGYALPDLLTAARAVFGGQSPYTFRHDPDATDESDFEIAVRGLRDPATTARRTAHPTPLDAIRAALADPADGLIEALLYWEDTRRLACLDIDYHAIPMDRRPTVDALESIAATIHPRPVARHASHGRGMKLYYVAESGFAADELAACAGMAWRNADGRATFEIKRESRHPAHPRYYTDKTIHGEDCINSHHCGPVTFTTSTLDLPAVAAWMGRSADPEAIEEWLSSQGLVRGQRYPHSRCPIAPDVASGHDATAGPVQPLDLGLHCFKCAAEGRARGGRRAGFVPYSALVGGIDTQAAETVKHVVHWPQAKHILGHCVGGPEPLLKLAYRAALKMIHGADPRIPYAFGAAPPLVRVGGRWLLSEATTLDRHVGKSLIAKLPAAMTVETLPDGTRECKADPALVDELRHGNNPLEKFGIANLTPIRGARIWGEHNPYPGAAVPFLVPAPGVPTDRQPRYVAPRSRMEIEQAWGEVERYYPGLNRAYVSLVIAAKGVAEGGAETPKILVDGVSAAGKSLHVEIAGGIAGDNPEQIPWVRDETRLRQSLYKAAETSDIVRIDEMVKAAGAVKVGVREALNFVLNLTPQSQSWQMYVGSAQIGRQLAVIVTDIVFPNDVMTDLQVARRFARVRLDNQVPNWFDTAVSAGLSSPAQMRGFSKELADACDAILSDIIDTHFSAPVTFREIAEKLGYPMIVEGEEYAAGDDELRSFFDLVCRAPTMSESDAKRFGGKGWKVISREAAGDDLVEAWYSLCDDQGEGWNKSRRAQAVDWGRILGEKAVLSSVRLDIASHGAKVYVRFWAGGSKVRPLYINQEIVGG